MSKYGFAALLGALVVFRLALHPLCEAIFERQTPPRAALSAHPGEAGLAAAALLVALALFWRLPRRALHLVELSRAEAAALLAAALAWTAPMLLDPGALLDDDWYTGQRAALSYLSSLRAGDYPGWSFLYGNGTSYGLQYPPLAYAVVAWLSLLSGLPVEWSFKLSTLVFQGVFLAGLYACGRFFGYSRLLCAVPAIAISFTQQYWATGFLHGASASFAANALTPHVVVFFLRCLARPSLRAAAGLGATMGWTLLAQPVAAYFLSCFLGLTLAVFLFDRGRIAKAAWFHTGLGAAMAAAVASPFLSAVAWLRPFNSYQMDVFAKTPPTAISWRRALWWNPRIGDPPGTGYDNSGYVGWGLLVLALAALYFWTRGSKNGRLLPLAWFFAGLTLCYGPALGLLNWFPFLPLTKGSYRLWPLLGLALLPMAAFSLRELSQSRTPRVAWVLALLAIVENAPFSLKTAFREAWPVEAALEPLLPRNDSTLLFLIQAQGQRRELYYHVYRWISQSGRADILYHHHEDIGVAGKSYWSMHDAISTGPSHRDFEDAVRKARWFGVNYLLFAGEPTWEYASLGAVRRVSIKATSDGDPKTLSIVTLSEGGAQRYPGRMIFPWLPSAELSAQGLRLPVSYYPFLAARIGAEAAQVSSDEGYVRIRQRDPLAKSRELELFLAYPLWWKFANWLSVVLSLGALVLATIPRRRRA
jgi:hypothetical protein